MNKIVTPVLLIVIAIGLYFLYTKPQLENVDAAKAEESKYTEAVEKAGELKEIRARLVEKRATFDPVAMERLKKLLPDNVDNVRLLIEVDSMAQKHNMTLRRVQFSQEGALDNQGGRVVATENRSKPYDSILLSFAVDARYDDFLLFMRDLEQSLRLADVESIQFESKEGTGVPTTYTVGIRTYWLKEPNNATF